MKTRMWTVISLAISAALAMALVTGCGVLGSSRESGGATADQVATQEAPQSAVAPPGSATDGPNYAGASGALGSATSEGSADSVRPDALVITNAAISVEVSGVDAALAAVKSIAEKYGATIANLTTSAGDASTPNPVPLGDSSGLSASPVPGSATITLRVPADKLAATEREIAALGRVTSQSSSQDDVTQQHVDMKARLKNLQAEEARLRTFFLKAKRVSEMLAIEQELSRVRGEVESLQAQIDYLERQAALATLTVSLSEPGDLVSPAGGTWGFGQAVRDGVRAAAAVLRGIITTLLALSPLIVLAIGIVIVVRVAVRRRRREHADQSEPERTTQL